VAAQDGEGGEDDDVLLAIIGGIDPGDDLVIDCLISDNHSFEAEVTDFPVESGSTISDNIRNKPLVVTMECLVSNTPIGQVVQFRDKNEDPVDTAYNAMIKIRNARKPVSIRTSLKTYKNMALQSLSVPRSSDRGDELRFTATWKQIETVTNRRDTRVAIVGAKSGGTRAATLVSDPLTQDTVFVQVPDLTWYDGAIGGWREQAVFPTARDVKSVNGTTKIGDGTIADPKSFEGVTRLVAARPIDIPRREWESESFQQHTSALLKPRIKAAQGARSNNFVSGVLFFRKDPKNIIEIHKGEFVVIRVVP